MSFFSRRSGAVRGTARGYVLALLAFALVPVWLWADAPAWWAQRGVLNPAATADDYAAVNQGQVKNIAKQAYEEMKATLPGGAGSTLDAIWATPAASTDDYRAINLGQLKNVAEPFYARLQQLHYTGQPLTTGQTRPWIGSANPADDYALANIGQVKNLFSFNLVLLNPDTDGDGLSDAEETILGTDPSKADTDGDGVSDYDEVSLNHTDPLDYFNGGHPIITQVSGGGQKGPVGKFLPEPWIVRLTDAQGHPLGNAPVTFTVDQGGLAATDEADAPTTTPIIIRTDANGYAWAYWKL